MCISFSIYYVVFKFRIVSFIFLFSCSLFPFVFGPNQSPNLRSIAGAQQLTKADPTQAEIGPSKVGPFPLLAQTQASPAQWPFLPFAFSHGHDAPKTASDTIAPCLHSAPVSCQSSPAGFDFISFFFPAPKQYTLRPPQQPLNTMLSFN